jgi:biotin carboxyl carrier protein
MTSLSTPLTPAQVGALARHFERSGLGLLRVEVPGLSLRIVGSSASGPAPMAMSASARLAPVASAAALANPAAVPGLPSGSVEVNVGQVGIFLTSHPSRSGANRFLAEAGHRVAAGDILGLVAQAKGGLFQVVRAPCAGTIAQRWIHDGERVQFGSRLFTITPDC